MTHQKIDAIEMTRGIREKNHERLNSMPRSERLAYYKEQARRMNARAAALLSAKGHKPERG